MADLDKEGIITIVKEDMNTSTSPDREADDLRWLVRTIQRATDVPICLDRSNPGAITGAM